MNPKIDFVPCGDIESIQDRDDLILIQDTYEIDQIWRDLKINPDKIDLYGLFVTVESGDYGEIYAYSGSVPSLSKTLYKMVIKQ